MTNHTLTGSCLCEKVTYRVTTELKQFYFCHCEQCRKITSSAFASNILAVPADVEWLTGAEYIKRYDHPSRSFTSIFCTECGCGLPFTGKNGKNLFIPAGSLDGDAPIKPGYNIFWEDRAKWIDEGLNAQHCDGFAPD